MCITQNGFDGLYASYLYQALKTKFSFLPSKCDLRRQGDGAELTFATEKAYLPYVRKFAEERMADVVAIGYKYAFLSARLPLCGVGAKQRRLLLTAIVAADFREDRAYALRRIRGWEKYSLDGIFHFRMQALRRRWEEIADCVPVGMGEGGAADFLAFVVEDGEGKVYLKKGRAYDGEYRPLCRSLLTGVASPIGEILLSGAEQVYCFGEVEAETRAFLQKYYEKNAFFY